MRNHAVWFGRFQPPTIAHLATLKTVLDAWRRLTIAVVDKSLNASSDPRHSVYLKKLDQSSFALGKNPFTSQEVVAMWQGCLREYDLEKEVEILRTPQPEYWPEFAMHFPPGACDYLEVAGGSGDPLIEAARRTFSAEMFEREVHLVTPPFFLHNIEIRKLMNAGIGTWQDYIPKGAYELFVQVGGETRMKSKTD